MVNSINGFNPDKNYDNEIKKTTDTANTSGSTFTDAKVKQNNTTKNTAGLSIEKSEEKEIKTKITPKINAIKTNNNIPNAKAITNKSNNINDKIKTSKITNVNQKVFELNKEKVENLEVKIESPKMQKELDAFKNIYNRNKATYQKVSDKTGVPPELIAAIHYREASCDFGILPTDGWESIGMVNCYDGETTESTWAKKSADIVKYMGDTANYSDLPKKNYTEKMAAILTVAERHNGLGYSNMGKNSPYLYSGTDLYKDGQYLVGQGYKENAKDQRPGVYVLVESVMERKIQEPMSLLKSKPIEKLKTPKLDINLK